MLERVDFPNEGLIALVSLERRNAIVIQCDPAKGKIEGRTLGALLFTSNGDTSLDRWRVESHWQSFPQSSQETIDTNWESKAQRKAQRKAKRKMRRQTSTAKCIDHSMANTLEIVFARMLHTN